MSLCTGTIAGPLLYCGSRSDHYIFSGYAWITLRLFQAIDAHSGYGELRAISCMSAVC